MRTGTIILLLTILTRSYSQGTVGTGLVKVDFTERTIIDLYKHPADKNHHKRIEFFFDFETGGWAIENWESEEEWLKPEVFDLGHYQFAFFRCKSKIKDWFELIVNNEKGITLWVKQSQVLTFVTWEEYLKEMFVVSRIKGDSQKIRQLPNDAADELKYDGGDCFQIKQLKGDWIEIFTPNDCDIKYIKSRIESGWIRWRHRDKLLIDYYKFG